MTDARPGSARRSTRRNKITRSDSLAVVAVGCAAGVAASLAHLHPTGWQGSDIALAFAMALLVVWSAASSPWWALAVAGCAAGVASSGVGWAVVAGSAVVVALVIGFRQLNQPAFRAMSAALTLQSLLHLRIGRFGVSALVTAGAVMLVVLSGLRRRNRFIRRRIRFGAIAVSIFCLVAIAGVAVAGLQARTHLQHGAKSLRDGASAVKRGDSATASLLFAAASQDFGAADRALHRPWSVLALATPVVGQHVRVLDDLTVAARSVAAEVSTQIRLVNLDDLKLSGGIVNVAAIQALEEPLRRTHDALGSLSTTLRSGITPWLVGPADKGLQSVREQVDSLVTQTERAGQAVSVAPSMLGVDGVRTYFIGFTNPAETRGLGGFLGNWAEVQVIDGRIVVVRSGRTKDLFADGTTNPVLTQSAEFFARYGRFGAGGSGRPVSVDYWSNITMSPDLPTVAGVIADLYPKSGGDPIDGVIIIDPQGLAGLLKLTGPVSVPGLSTPIDANTAPQFLMRDQYTEFPDAEPERAEALQRVTEAATAALLGGQLPGVRVIADALGPAITDGHLAIWSLKQSDQAALTALGVSNSLPAPSGDGVVLVTNNSGGNKLDAYLKRSLTYTGVADARTGVIETVATVNLTNDTPADVLSLPDYVAGNAEQLPKGTNRSYVSLYSLLPLTAATQDGVAIGTEVEREKGWAVYSLYVDIPPGATAHLTFHLRGKFDPKTGYTLALMPQSLANPQATTVQITNERGAVAVAFQGVLHEPTVLGRPAR